MHCSGGEFGICVSVVVNLFGVVLKGAEFGFGDRPSNWLHRSGLCFRGCSKVLLEIGVITTCRPNMFSGPTTR